MAHEADVQILVIDHDSGDVMLSVVQLPGLVPGAAFRKVFDQFVAGALVVHGQRGWDRPAAA